jgi:ABC-2 type transport system permease protein
MTVSIDSVDCVEPVISVRSNPERAAFVRRRLSMVAHQVHYDELSLVRNRTAQGFAFAMPVSFLVLFVAIFGNGTVHVDGQAISGSTYYVAALTVFGIVDVAFMALLIALVDVRETGVLRRRRATPQPAWTIVAGRALTTLLSGMIMAALLLAVGWLAYGASVPLRAVPALVASVALGVVVFSCLGFAVAGLVRSFDSAQPVAMAFALPLAFISGVFIPWAMIPHWLQQVSVVFPVRALAVGLLDPYLAGGPRSPWDPTAMAVLAGWGVLGAIVAVRLFRWAPQDL